MATTFPESIQTFPTMTDITANDAVALKAFQQAMQNGKIADAQAALLQIENYQNKIITADYLNTLYDTCVALEEYYITKYSPAYVVSGQAPAAQEPTDFWFKITRTVG